MVRTFKMEPVFRLGDGFNDDFFGDNAQVRSLNDVFHGYFDNLLEEFLLSNYSWFSLIVPDGQLVAVCLSSLENRSSVWANFLNQTIDLGLFWSSVL